MRNLTTSLVAFCVIGLAWGTVSRTALAVPLGNAKISTSATLDVRNIGHLTPLRALSWPDLPKDAQEPIVYLPVVHVRFNLRGSRIPLLPAPSLIPAIVPGNLSHHLAAYFVQVDADTSFYLLGPPGMTGQAGWQTDGLFDVKLHSKVATLDVEISNGSPRITEALAAPFFQAARNAGRKVGLNVPKLIAPVTVVRPNVDSAYFAFATKNRNVAGFDYYSKQPNERSARMVFVAKSGEWSIAPWVMQAGTNLLDNILAPEIGGMTINPSAPSVDIRGHSVVIPNSNGDAIQTPRGTAWIWWPTFTRKMSATYPTNAVPTGSYFLALNQLVDGKVDLHTLQLVQSIPWVRSWDGNNDVYYGFPGYLSIKDHRWIVYPISWAGLGMAQPETNDLYAYDLKTGRDRRITSFHIFGGTFFAFGTSGHYLAYDQSGAMDAKGDLVHNVWLVDLATGKEIRLPTSDLKSDIVHTMVHGQSITIRLKSYP